jgi:hypothetical protein
MTVFSLDREFLYVYVSILYCALYYILGKVTRGEGENTGINIEKELSAVMVKPSALPTRTKGYSAYHCPATSKCASIIFII